MKKIVIALVALLPLAGVAQAQTVKDMLATLRAKWNAPTEPFKIIGNVYYVGSEQLASFLVTTPEGHILINSSFESTVPVIRAAYRPDEKTVTWARAVLDAAARERGVFSYQGRMVDEPVLRHARGILARAGG